MMERESLLQAAKAARYAEDALKPEDWQPTFPKHPKFVSSGSGCCRKGGVR